jgi:Undecaprenyl-phosphate glucose phosphotransferase
MSGGLMIAWRLVLHATIACLHDVGLELKQVAIVGSDGNCNSIIENINRAKHSGYRASAVLNIVPDSSFRNTSVTVFQDQDAFIDHVRSRGIREVWLALPLSQEHMILRIVNALRDDLVNLRFIPDVRSVALFEGGVSRLLGEAAINLSVSPPSRSACVKKEIFDRGFALAALVAITPLLIGIAIAIKVSSPGPVLFKQRRKGVDGRIFTIYKFRSMHVHTAPAGVLHQATRNDPRVTRVGAILRRTSLDELPQFFNVLRGDMSVVGPRPHALEHDYIYEKVVPGYIHRYRVKPGLTGWAQVNGFRGETDKIEKMEGRVAFDLYYVTNWSFALDMRIIFGTIIKGLRDVNAY